MIYSPNFQKMSNILKRTVFQRNLIKFNQRQTTHNVQTRVIRYFIDDASNSQLTEGEKYLYDKLRSKFQPTKLQVEDVSGGLFIIIIIFFLCSYLPNILIFFVIRRMWINVCDRNFFKGI
jgi:hypothetical protein